MLQHTECRESKEELEFLALHTVKAGVRWLDAQVQALWGEVLCRTEVTGRPAPPPPARTYAALRPGAPDVLRTAALLAAWIGSGAAAALGLLDRRNATRSQGDLMVCAPAFPLDR